MSLPDTSSQGTIQLLGIFLRNFPNQDECLSQISTFSCFFRFRDIPWLTFRISSTLSTSSAKASFARMERSMLAADAERVVAVTKLDGRGSRHGDYQIEIL